MNPVKLDRPVYLAGYSTRALAVSALRGGYEPFSFDAFGDRDRGPGLRVPALALGTEGIHALVSALTRYPPGIVAWGGSLENYPEALTVLGSRHWLWGNHPGVVAQVRQWSQLAAHASSGPVKLPPTVLDQVPGEGRWILKPRRSGGGHGIRWAAPMEPVPPGWMAQQYVVGHPVSLTFLADGRHIQTAFWTRAFFSRQHFRYRGGIGGPGWRNPFAAAGYQLAAELTRRFGLIGWNGLDFVAAPDGLYLLEINPRWTGSVEFWDWATGQSAFHALAAVMTQRPLHLMSPWRYNVGKLIVYAPGPCQWRDPWPRMADGVVQDLPWPGQSFAAGQPVCTLIAWGPSWRALRARLVAWERQIGAWLTTSGSERQEVERHDLVQ
jgi:predicted ATP-grasp superfamily ATP-dependent carboligase